MANKTIAKGMLNAWQNGPDLENALRLFEPRLDAAELRKKAEEQRRFSKIGKRNFGIAGISELNPILDHIGNGLATLSEATLSRESRVLQLIDALEKGELIALGFPTDRPKLTVPVAVPSFLIQRSFANFRRSEFSDGECRYSKVRVVRAAALPKPEIGRPSVRASVFELALALATKGEIARDMPPKVQTGKIRKLGNFSESALSDQTIRRHLKSFWESN